MSVVVFDGKTLAADSLMRTGGVLSTFDKLGSNEHFRFAFVGAPALAQCMVSRLYEAWPDGLAEFNEWSMGLSDRLVDDEGARALIIPRNQDDMVLLTAGLPALVMERQPFYLGADEGESLFNYCKAMIFPTAGGAANCVRMCIEASSVSAEPFALAPIRTI